METWFKVNHYGSPTITPVQVVKHTGFFITLPQDSTLYGTRERRVTIGKDYYPTFEAARKYLFDEYVASCESYQRQLEKARMYMGIAFKMEPPKENQ